MIPLFWTFTVLLNLKIRVSETDRQSAPVRVSCMIPLWRERIESHRVCMKDKTKSRITVDTCFTLIFQVLFFLLLFYLFIYLFIFTNLSGLAIL